MTADQKNWFLATQALDHRETTAALAAALPEVILDETELDQDAKNLLADELAVTLARTGYALVLIAPAQHERTEDLTPFLSRKED